MGLDYVRYMDLGGGGSSPCRLINALVPEALPWAHWVSYSNLLDLQAAIACFAFQPCLSFILTGLKTFLCLCRVLYALMRCGSFSSDYFFFLLLYCCTAVQIYLFVFPWH